MEAWPGGRVGPVLDVQGGGERLRAEGGAGLQVERLLLHLAGLVDISCGGQQGQQRGG